MRSFTQFSKGLFATGILAASLVGISGCGPNYSLFKVTVTSKDIPREKISSCLMTITDEQGRLVLDSYQLKAIPGAAGELLVQGCAPSLTPQNIGTLSYSSSRTSGALTFKVEAFDDSNGGHALVQTSEHPNVDPTPYTPKTYNGPNDEISVPITIGIP
jgi:hypothetical protein